MEVIEGTFPYNRGKYITSVGENFVHYPDYRLQQNAGQIYIQKLMPFQMKEQPQTVLKLVIRNN